MVIVPVLSTTWKQLRSSWELDGHSYIFNYPCLKQTWTIENTWDQHLYIGIYSCCQCYRLYIRVSLMYKAARRLTKHLNLAVWELRWKDAFVQKCTLHLKSSYWGDPSLAQACALPLKTAEWCHLVPGGFAMDRAIQGSELEWKPNHNYEGQSIRMWLCLGQVWSPDLHSAE